MEHLPVFLKLDGKPCLVVGGGVVAERKVMLLTRAGARVTIAAPSLTPKLAGLRDTGAVSHHDGAFASRLLEGQRLVIAASSDPAVNAAVARAAEEAGVLCNVVDDGAASSFIVPAIVDRSPVVVAIGTGGNAPVLAQTLKARIEAWLPARIGALASRAGGLRDLVKKRFRTMRERRRFWQRFFDGPIADDLLAGRTHRADRNIRLELLENVEPRDGRVGEAYIVGAGPGDPGLVTLRAQQLLSRADVVLHDSLVSASILDLARKDAELINVGKKAGAVTYSQEQINDLLVRRVRAGERVCRLKGGDPLVFGRGGEEARALADAGLPYEIVPGISAALGCAAYAGIPLTHRGVSGSVTFATAKLEGGREPDWTALARSGQTLVLYMSARSAARSARRLVAHGMPLSTPAALVENGTTDRQRIVHGTLATIGDLAARARIRSPAVLIVGETAALGRELAWFDSNPVGAALAANQASSPAGAGSYMQITESKALPR